MSPAPLNLERYIGSCLISAGIPHHHLNHPNNYQKREPSQTRYRRYPLVTPQCHQTVNEYCLTNNGNQTSAPTYPRTWTTAAGLPLISMSPSSPRRGIIKDNKQDERTPLSRLAIHTQGAPLIQAGRQQPRLIKQNNKQQKKEKETKDFSSVASDESSGNSENSLPRIIKPRKRRKKDRKPQPTTGATTQINQQNVDTLQDASIVTLKPYTPLCQDFKPNNTNQNVVKVVEDSTKRISTIINDNIINEYKVDDRNNPPACQCRYCDPINLTWDVDQRCYSPYLTPPNNYKSSQEWSLDSRGSSLEVSSEIITSPNGHRDIEIKFFSASPPVTKSVVSPPRPISVTPPWPN